METFAQSNGSTFFSFFLYQDSHSKQSPQEDCQRYSRVFLSSTAWNPWFRHSTVARRGFTELQVVLSTRSRALQLTPIKTVLLLKIAEIISSKVAGIQGAPVWKLFCRNLKARDQSSALLRQGVSCGEDLLVRLAARPSASLHA